MSFLLGKGPLLGFGEGGPQFDRKGIVDRMRNGQGGYQLRTHGGRVPIQWLIGTDGWGLFIHHPLGAFDLTGPKDDSPRRRRAAARRVRHRIDRPGAIIARVRARSPAARICRALWTFGYMQSHRTLARPRRGDVSRADVPREEAAVRRA